MTAHPLTRALAMILVIALVAPAAFFIAPQRTSAAGGILGAIGCIGSMLGVSVSGLASQGAGAVASAVGIPGVGTALGGGIPVIDSQNLAQNSTSASATSNSCINDTILMPLARAIARMILAQITASTINWITGKNGSGSPMFVQSISIHLQSVGDSAALPFINQVRTGFNSPFGPTIASALQTQYNQQTSVAGFFAANQSTLARSSPNVNAFLAGNWSQGGGIPAWFALTTQPQNNPYMLYQAAQGQLSSNVSQATTNRRQDLLSGQGFLSWCPGDSVASGSANPQAQCTNPDGTPAKAATPGSVIHDYTQKAVVAAGIDQLITAQDLDASLGAIASALVTQVLSGSGLFGASQSSGGRPAITAQLQNYSANNSSAAASATALAQTTMSNISAYTGAWNSISTAANTASTTLANLASFCTSAAAAATDSPSFATAARAQATAAQNAITTEIVPVLVQVQAAISSVASTQALAIQTQSDALAATSAAAATNGAGGALSADTQALGAAHPSTSDVANAQAIATVTNSAVANPAGSLTVSNGTLVDQMNLITANATAIKASTACVELGGVGIIEG